MSCGVGHRRSSDLALLWFWHRLAATAPIGPLAWESPYATGAALEMAKKGVPVVAQWLTNPPRNHEFEGSIPALAQWIRVLALP